MNARIHWSEKDSLILSYSHRAIINDLTDTIIICRYVKRRIKNILNILDLTKQKKIIKSFIKWIQLISDNMKCHYEYRRAYYFESHTSPICKELKDETDEIKRLNNNILAFNNIIKLNIYKTKNGCIYTIIKNIHSIETNIKTLMPLIKNNFNKKQTKLLPNIIKDVHYSNVRAIDIKICLKSKWYTLPHMFREMSAQEYLMHMEEVLQLPKVALHTIVALYFKRYRMEYIPIMEILLPSL